MISWSRRRFSHNGNVANMAGMENRVSGRTRAVEAATGPSSLRYAMAVIGTASTAISMINAPANWPAVARNVPVTCRMAAPASIRNHPPVGRNRRYSNAGNHWRP